MKIKIGVFDDLKLVTNWLKESLKKFEDIEFVWTTNTIEETLRKIQLQPVDILIADVLTGEEVGLELFESIQRMELYTKVIAFSQISDKTIIDYLYNYGVSAFVNKNDSIEELYQVITNVMHEAKVKHKHSTAPPVLTSKEILIGKYLSQGLASKEIATLTNNSVHTINNQKNHLLEKFSCANSTELVLKLCKMGYISV